MGLSRVVNFVKEDPKTGNTVTVDAWTSYKLEKGDEALVRKETRFYRFDKSVDYNDCVERALTRAALDYFGWTEERLQAQMEAVTQASAEKPVEKPVETVDKPEESEAKVEQVESVPMKEEDSKPVVKKKTRRKKKASTKKKVEVVEPVAEAVEPVLVEEEEDEFADLVEPVVELVPFDRDNMPHRPHMTAYIVSKLGRDWKAKPENKTLVNRFLIKVKDVPLFTPMGEPREDFSKTLDKYFV